MRDVLADQGVTPEAEALHLEAYARVITKENSTVPLTLIGIALGLVICWLLMRSPSVSSPRMEQLVRDSVEYANKVRKRDSLYMDLWIEYTYKDDSLSSALDDLDRARRTRPPSDYRDADSLHRAIRKEVGLEPR